MTNQPQSEAPIVEFALLGEPYPITDYIQVNHPELKRIANQFRGNPNEIIVKVARFVAKHIKYPFDRNGKPTAHRHIRIFRFHGPLYLFDTGEVDYGWLFPIQVLKTKRGICFDTACLATTLLRIKGLEAYTVFGALLENKSYKLKGFHAWTETVDKDGRKVVIETTAHKKPAVYLAEHAYGGKLPLVYDPVIWFNECFWREDREKARKYVEMAMNVLTKRGEILKPKHTA